MTRRITTLVHACILMGAFGTGVAAFGPLLPELARDNGLSMSQMGLIFPAVFVGTVPASLLVGFAIDRIGAARIMLFAIPVLGGAAVGITFSRSIHLLLLLSLFVGIGGGAGVPTANALIVNLFGRRSVPAVNLLNVFFGIGAVTGPALVSLGFGLFNTGAPTFWFAAAVALATMPYFARSASRGPLPSRSGRAAGDAAGESGPLWHGERAASEGSGPPPQPGRSGVGAGEDAAAKRPLPRGERLPAGRPKARSQTGATGERQIRAALLFRSPLLWLIGGMLFFDVGTEQTLGGWISVYMQESTPLAIATAALVVSGFWITFTAGRLAGAAIGTKITARWVLVSSLAAALAGIVAVNLVTGHAELSIAAFLLTGFGLGPVYPTTMALIGTTFAARAGTVIGATAALGSVGGMALPWLEGIFIGAFGPPGAARLLAAATAAIALFSVSTIIFITVRRSSRSGT